MTRAAPNIPLVVLPDPAQPPASVTLPEPVRVAVSQAAAALDRLHGLARELIDRRERLDEALDEATARMRTVAALLARTAAEVTAETLPVRAPVHTYFGVRGAVLSPAQAAAHAALVLYRGLADLSLAPIDINDLAAETAAMRLVLTDLAGVPDEPHPPLGGPAVGGGPHPLLDFVPAGGGMDRWIVAHHVYFLFNVRAAALVHEALAALGRSREEEAARLLDRAARYVRGFTAAMMHSAAIPASHYADHIRQSMAPPAAPMNLTGRLQPEHKAFRTAMDALVAELPETYDRLAVRSPALAAARGALLEVDLIDIERHICVADALVGDDRSLVQPDGGSENAVAVLRLMRHLRAAAYCPAMPYGDRFAAAAKQTTEV